MNAQHADELAKQLAILVRQDRPGDAYALLAPILAERTPFRLLDRIGAAVGVQSIPQVGAFLECIAAAGTEGGWVVMASALRKQIESDLAGALTRARHIVAAADIWYGADIVGERVPGPALVECFNKALPLLEPWREDGNRWVRRTVGVAVHYWAKRSRGAHELGGQAQALLAYLDPLFGEWEMDAVKGVGWGLKTLGRYYPLLVADWLDEQVLVRGRRHRALMRRKAMTYLPEDNCARLVAGVEAGLPDRPLEDP